MEFTIKDFEEFLNANGGNEEVKSVLRKAIKPEMKAEQFKSFIDSPEGKVLISPEIDRRVTDAIKTFRENHFEKEVTEKVSARIKELNPDETPEMKRIRELEDLYKKSENQAAKERLDRQILELASKKGVKPSLLAKVKFQDVAEAESFITDFLAEKDEIEKNISNSLLKRTATSPTSGSNSGNVKLKDLGVKELMALEEAGKLDAMIMNQS